MILASSSATALLALALAGAAAPAPIQIWRASPTSPKVVLAPGAGHEATVRVIFMAGAADDGIEEGLTRLSQYAILHGQGSAPYGDFDAALYGAAATINVDTSVRECSFELSAPSSTFDAVAARMLSQVLKASVSSAGVDRAKKLASTDLLEVGSDKWMQALVAASVMITEGVEGGGDYNNPLFGDPDTIRRIPAESVKKHIATKLAPANSVVVVTGKFNVAKIKAALAKYKGGVERPLRRPDIVKYLPFERDHTAPREVHMQIQVVDVKDAKSAAVVHVLAAYLHDKLFFKLRKSGYVYSPFVATAFEEWLDFILVAFTVTKGGKVDYRKMMMEEIDTAAEGKIDNASLERARGMALGRLQTIEDNPSMYADALAPRARGAVTVGPEVRAAIASVDAAALVDASAQFLGRNRAVSFVFGTTRTDAADAKRGAPDPYP